MEFTTKELRIQPGRIIHQALQGDGVTISFRGKALAKIVPLDAPPKRRTRSAATETEPGIFGMWGAHDEQTSVDALVRDMRSGRTF